MTAAASAAASRSATSGTSSLTTSTLGPSTYLGKWQETVVDADQLELSEFGKLFARYKPSTDIEELLIQTDYHTYPLGFLALHESKKKIKTKSNRHPSPITVILFTVLVSELSVAYV